MLFCAGFHSDFFLMHAFLKAVLIELLNRNLLKNALKLEASKYSKEFFKACKNFDNNTVCVNPSLYKTSVILSKRALNLSKKMADI